MKCKLELRFFILQQHQVVLFPAFWHSELPKWMELLATKVGVGLVPKLHMKFKAANHFFF